MIPIRLELTNFLAYRNPAPLDFTGIHVAAADADGWLFGAFERIDAQDLSPSATAAVRDTALAFYGLAGISTKDKAFAAYVLSNAYAEINDDPNALRWAREALNLEPASQVYQRLVTSLSGRQP